MIYNISTWINDKSKHITIQDILNLNNNEELDLLCIDRNFYDLIDHNIGKEPMNYKEFFKKSYKLKYIHGKDCYGQGQFNDLTPKKFNFELEYNEHQCWYPLNDDGILPDVNIIGRKMKTSYGNNYRDYPTYTRLGWRGPMIKINDINKDDKFYYNAE